MSASQNGFGLSGDGAQGAVLHAMLATVAATPALNTIELCKMSLARLLRQIMTTCLGAVLGQGGPSPKAQPTLDTRPTRAKTRPDRLGFRGLGIVVMRVTFLESI